MIGTRMKFIIEFVDKKVKIDEVTAHLAEKFGPEEFSVVKLECNLK